MSTPSEMDRREAEAIVREWCGNKHNLEIVNDPVYGLNSSGHDMADRIARALAARSSVPDGHAWLPGGREVKVTNTEALAEAIKQPAMCIECGVRPKVGLNWCAECCEVVARRAIAAEAAARGGER